MLTGLLLGREDIVEKVYEGCVLSGVLKEYCVNEGNEDPRAFDVGIYRGTAHDILQLDPRV